MFESLNMDRSQIYQELNIHTYEKFYPRARSMSVDCKLFICTTGEGNIWSGKLVDQLDGV